MYVLRETVISENSNTQESISMTIYTIIPPTVIYIKEHLVTKKKYLGKTTAKDPFKYKGSGVYWKDHIRVHGPEHVQTTIIFGPCTDSDVISKFAVDFSIKNNIVDSDDWANLRIENGLDGGITGISSPNKGKHCSIKTKKKMSDVRLGKPKTTETKKKMSKPKSAEHCQSISKGKTGVSHRKIECPHCGKIGGINTMGRWHFDHCKLKPD